MVSTKTLREIRALMRMVNFTGTSHSQAKLKKCLGHTLRLIQSEDDISFNEQLSHLNLIFHDNQWIRLDDLSDTQKVALMDRILLPPKPKQGTDKSRKSLRQYRAKLVSSIQSEKDKGHDLAAGELETLLNIKEEINSEFWLKKLSDIELSRKSQRLSMIQKYIKLHNRLSALPPDLSRTMTQEIIFTIPRRYDIGEDLVSGVELANLLKGYVSHYFADYEIKTVVVHRDERHVDENGNVEKTGAHVHLFLAGKNTKTLKYDLRLKNFHLAERMLSSRDKNYKKVATTDTTSFKPDQQSQFGEAIQEIFRCYANHFLFVPKGLKMMFDPERKRKSDKRKEMDRQAKLPKNQRDYNYFTREAEFKLREIRQLTIKQEELLTLFKKESANELTRQRELLSQNQLVDSHLIEKERNLLQLNKKVCQANKELHTTIDEINDRYQRAEANLDQFEAVKDMLVTNINLLKQALKQLTDAFIDRLTPIIEDVFKTFIVGQRDELDLKKKIEYRLKKRAKCAQQDVISSAIVTSIVNCLRSNTNQDDNTLSPTKKRQSKHTPMSGD